MSKKATPFVCQSDICVCQKCETWPNCSVQNFGNRCAFFCKGTAPIGGDTCFHKDFKPKPEPLEAVVKALDDIRNQTLVWRRGKEIEVLKKVHKITSRVLAGIESEQPTQS